MATARGSVMEAARFAYGFLRHRFGAVIGRLWLPVILATLCLYAGTMGYFEQVLRYLEAPDPRVSQLALSLLSAGFLGALFFWSLGIAAIANLALGSDAPSAMPLRIGKSELRLYFAYLRFILLLGLLGAGAGFFFSSLGPLFQLGGVASALLLTLAILAALFWFTVRVGFLIPAVAATGKGTILRGAWRQSEGQTLRIAGLILVLVIPALLVHVVGEVVMEIAPPAPIVPTGNRVADYTRLAQSGFATFSVVLAVSSFFTIALLTAGAVGFHRQLTPQE